MEDMFVVFKWNITKLWFLGRCSLKRRGKAKWGGGAGIRFVRWKLEFKTSRVSMWLTGQWWGKVASCAIFGNCIVMLRVSEESMELRGRVKTLVYVVMCVDE